MDNSRVHDLEVLKERMNDESKPLFLRKQAYRAFNSIVGQMNDRDLRDLRTMMIRAIKAGDISAVDKIEKRIRDHERRQPWYLPRTT